MACRTSTFGMARASRTVRNRDVVVRDASKKRAATHASAKRREPSLGATLREFRKSLRDFAGLHVAVVRINPITQNEMLASRQPHAIGAAGHIGELRFLAAERVRRHESIASDMP